MKFDIDPGYIFRLLLQFTLVNLIQYRECKKTSLTSLSGTRYTVYGADIFFLISTVCNTQRKRKKRLRRIVLLFYVHGKHLHVRSCRDGQLT